MALHLTVQIGRVDRVDHIAVGVAGSDAGIVMVVVAVPVSGVVGSIAQVAGSVVGSVGGSVVRSMSRSSVGVGGGGDHGLTGSSAHMHLLTVTHAPLVLA